MSSTMSNTVLTSWNYGIPPEREQQYDLQLMTICGVSVLGRWSGELGEFYTGWAHILGATPAQLQPYNTNIPDFEQYMRPEVPTYVN